MQWLLENGTSQAASYLTQLDVLSVTSRCGCGCASINFCPSSESAIDILSDYQWDTSDGHLCGIFLFARDQQLAGLETWSIDGMAKADRLPNIEDLRPISS